MADPILSPAALAVAETSAANTIKALTPIRTEVRQAHGGTLTLHWFAEFSIQPA